MKLALQIQLLPAKDQSDLLRQTVEGFNSACTWLAQQAFNTRLANKVKLQRLYYRELRNRFRLSAQMAAICIRHVGATYSRDRNKLPRFRKHAAMPYDSRILSFKGVDFVSLLTFQGRVIMPFVMGKYQRERFALAKGQCDLVLRKDGKWFLLVTADLPDKTPIPTTDFIGVDLGVTNIATTSDGQTFSGNGIETVRQKYHTRRAMLQQAASKRKARSKRPRSIRRALKRVSERESNFRKHTNHVISKRLVRIATDTARGIAMEELTHIRERARFRKSQRAKMAGWSFSQLRLFVDYKARLAGIPLFLVNPRNTSRTCNQCGHCGKANRKSQSEFACQSCGHIANADINAARNIRVMAVVNQPKVSESVAQAA